LTSFPSENRANLIEQLTEAHSVAGRAAESRVRVNLREFVDRWRQLRRIHSGGKFKWCL
jgi:hypothetical protein